jgi:hypothetical protein
MDYYKKNVIPEFNNMKSTFFDPDEIIIFHRRDILKKRGPFKILIDDKVRNKFDNILIKLLSKWDYKVVTVVLDKLEHREKYRTWRYHPYHYCLMVLIERFVLFLDENNAKGDVLVENRGKQEDNKLKDSFSRLYNNGNEYISSIIIQNHLTSKNLKVKPKDKNIAGLQIADLIAFPSRREILIEHSFLTKQEPTFNERITEILNKNKYLRSTEGYIEGFGKKILP